MANSNFTNESIIINGNSSSSEEDAVDPCLYLAMPYLEEKFFLITVFGGTLGGFAAIGNAILIYVFGTRPHFRRSYFVYFTAMAGADLLTGICYILVISMSIAFEYTRNIWLMDRWYEYVIPLTVLSNVAMCASPYFLVVASIERYFAYYYNVVATGLHRMIVILGVLLLSCLSKGTILFEIEVVDNMATFNCTGLSSKYLDTTPLRMDPKYDTYWCFYYRNLVTVFLPFTLLVYLNLRIILSDYCSLQTFFPTRRLTFACHCPPPCPTNHPHPHPLLASLRYYFHHVRGGPRGFWKRFQHRRRRQQSSNITLTPSSITTTELEQLRNGRNEPICNNDPRYLSSGFQQQQQQQQQQLMSTKTTDSTSLSKGSSSVVMKKGGGQSLSASNNIPPPLKRRLKDNNKTTSGTLKNNNNLQHLPVIPHRAILWAQRAKKRVRKASTRTLIVIVLEYLICNTLALIVTAWEHIAFEQLFDHYKNFYLLASDIISLLVVMACAIRLPTYLVCDVTFRKEFVYILWGSKLGGKNRKAAMMSNSSSVFGSDGPRRSETQFTLLVQEVVRNKHKLRVREHRNGRIPLDIVGGAEGEEEADSDGGDNLQRGGVTDDPHSVYLDIQSCCTASSLIQLDSSINNDDIISSNQKYQTLTSTNNTQVSNLRSAGIPTAATENSSDRGNFFKPRTASNISGLWNSFDTFTMTTDENERCSVRPPPLRASSSTTNHQYSKMSTQKNSRRRPGAATTTKQEEDEGEDEKNEESVIVYV